MEKPHQKNGWMSVPEFGGWDQKASGATDYSMVFSQARANKKQSKTKVARNSFGNERELMTHAQVESPMKNGWMPVPEFGGCDQKASGATDYSMVFSRARANKKQNKTEVARNSFGNERELMAHAQVESPMNNGWMSVPQFGGWDQKTSGATDYSMVFSRARANKKQNKTEVSRNSFANERELKAHTQVEFPMKRKKLLSYFSCCIKL